MENCKCNVPSASQEVKTPGPNRGRWYWRCPTGSCRFFKWDDSALPFIRHPSEIYAAAAPLDGPKRRPMSLPFSYIRGKELVLNRTTVKIVFSLISDELIGLKSQKNLTLDPLIARIQDIQWNESLAQWTIPATLSHYQEALESLPHDLPNIILEIDKIPDKVLEGIFRSVDYENDPNLISESELCWLEFVESPMYQQLNEFQREGVRLGIERRGRILYGNENGLGIAKQALALASAYRREWPVLLTCPSILCDTWREVVQIFFDLQPSEICMLDDEPGVLFQRNKKTNLKSKKRKISRKSSPPTPTVSSKSRTRFRKPYKKAMREGLENGYFEESDSDDRYEQHPNTALSESEQESDSERQSQTKFYIVSHLKLSKNKTRVAERQFKVAICDGSNYLKSKDQNMCQNICQVLEKYRRVILLSNKALYSLPVDLYPQISLVDNQWFPEMDTFVQRYCNPKSTVFWLVMEWSIKYV
ncbi:hypothetical protein BD560DRAFT_151396 [Blakeslea trispora]|nr:hypothetical protein BD560DRAFT_151396 [Blakeslea trispora]